MKAVCQRDWKVLASSAMEARTKLTLFVFIFALGASAATAADDSKDVAQIPLNTIWAADMPGTLDVYELEKGTGSRNHPAPLSDDIAGALKFIRQGQTTAKGFAVVGTGKEALRNAHAVLAKKQKPRQSFSTKANISLVFFSHSFGQYVHLDSVERREKTVKIAYRFVPHETKQLTAHYALIPLGKLPVGKYKVDIVRLPLEQQHVDQGFKTADAQWNNRVVCQSFSFKVVELETSDKDEKRTIPLSDIVTTSPQTGLRDIKDAMQQKATGQNPETFLRQLHETSRGYSTLFLVDATDLHDALSAGFTVLAGSQAVDTPAPPSTPNPKLGKYWLVVYLGSGPSNPTWWTVESVTVEKSTIRLTYHKTKPRPATDDIRRYYFWIPLRKLTPGDYELQLFDSDKAAVTLMRRVEVTPTKGREDGK